ncbi:hypothetical protein BBJ28_00001773 [Nothophytophthora sp. Chile5]|nr:hypothetical protein BBJ28_00001773 [Nothophytophthora sp. Chile5]
MTTSFGQSSGFGGQPPLPPGGMASAPPLSSGGFGKQPPLPPGGLAGAPPLSSGGFGRASGGNPFGHKEKSGNDSATTFGGGRAFGRRDGSSSVSASHTAFGSASSVNGKFKDQATAFGGNNASFGGNGASFGGNGMAFNGLDTGFGGNGAASSASFTSFGAPTPKREKAPFSHESDNSFRSGGAASPSPLPSPSTSFGSQTAGVRVRKKQITPTTASARGDNPFAAGGGGGSSGPSIHTAFGGAATDHDSQPPAFGNPTRKSPASVGAPATAFGGGGKDKHQQITPKFGSKASAGGFTDSAKMSSVEARMGGAKKSPSFGKGKRTPGFGSLAEQETEPFGGQPTAPRSNRKFPGEGTTFGAAPEPNSTNGNNGKHRQPRVKKKAMHLSDEDAGSAPISFESSAVHDDNSKAELSAATNLDGLCADMCSPTERELHIRVDELSVFEKCFPDRPGAEQEMIIKRFQRSSADHKLDISEEIRPPGVLRRTQLYIEQEIMDREHFGVDLRFQTPRVPDPIELYNFCWDRFRMIRKDFVLQNYRGAGGRVHPIALDVHERIARYLVLSEHELIEVPSFVAQQNMEQLGQTLKSLNELYDESHKVGDPAYLSPFEAECRAYFILCTLDNGRGMDVLKYVKDLPKQIMASPHIKFAMRVFVARHTSDYHQFFSLLREATYLQACLLFRYLTNARSSALLRMNRAYRGQTYPLEELGDLLCFEDVEHAYSVCAKHGLAISGRPGAGDDGAILVKFGGEFETGTPRVEINIVCLRIGDREKSVLTHAVMNVRRCPAATKQGPAGGAKLQDLRWHEARVRLLWSCFCVIVLQFLRMLSILIRETPSICCRNYFRRDICRGVTEYAPDEYPALSKLIQDYEMAERAKLYPTRPVYEDDYSYFVDYNEGVPAQSPSAMSTPCSVTPIAAQAFETFSSTPADQQPAETEKRSHDLEMIAQRRMELERKQHEAMQRIRELEQAKKEKVRREQEKKATREQEKKATREDAARDEEKARAETIAKAHAAQEAEEAERRQQLLEAQLREQKKQREIEEQRRRVEEAAREAERERLAAHQRAEALKAKAAEEERRRQVERLQEEARRKEAEALERRRQQQLAEERARQEREAALEALRQAQLAKEREERKRVQRIEKQKRAILKLRLRLWKKYVQESRRSPGPIAIDATKLQLEGSHQKAKESMQWLFKRVNGATAAPFGTRKPRIQTSTATKPAPDTEQQALWRSADVVALVGASLRRRNPGSRSIAWKVVIADLLDGNASSFGLWCAVRAGTQDAELPESDCHRIFQSSSGLEAQNVAVCCRYLDSTFGQQNTRDVQQEKLAATSAIVLPVDLSVLQGSGACERWQQRLEEVLAALRQQSRVALFVLAFASAEIQSNRASLLDKLESCVRQVQTQFPSQVESVGFDLIEPSSAPPHKFAEMLIKIAASSPPQPQLSSVGLKELLENSVRATMNQYESSVGIQIEICSVFPRVREDILSFGILDLAYPPPELQQVVLEPPFGWNSQEKRHEIGTVLTALEVTRIAVEDQTSAVDRLQFCDVYFNKIVDFIDRLFRSYPASTAVSTYELKKRVYSTLLPVHEQLSDNAKSSSPKAQVSPEEADSLLPWRKIFEEIYGAFFETLSDMNIYYPADWRARHMSTFGLLDDASAPERKPLLIANGDSKRNSRGAAPPAAVSMKSLKRSFGGGKTTNGRLSIIDESLRERRASGEVKRLRVEIAKERAATSQFQRMLRQELKRWSMDEAPL